MPRPARRAAALLAVPFLTAAPLYAQDLPADRPAVLPAASAGKAARDRAEAVTLYGLGAVHQGQHRLLEALRCYEAACGLDPDAAPPRRALVPLYLAVDRTDDAFAAARRALELDPDDWETGSLYARQLRARGDTKGSAEALRRAAGSPRLREKVDALAQLRADLAQLDEEAGDWHGAAASLRELADLLDHPAALVELGTLTPEDARAKAAEAYEALGRVRLKAGEPDKAVAAFEAARARDPVRAGRLALHLAEIHDRAGRPREALARLDEYLAGRPAGTEGYEMKARLLRQLGEAERIVPGLRAAADDDPHNTALALLLARELRRAGRPGDAEAVYRRLAGDGPGPDVYRGLFGLCKEEGAAGGDKALSLLDRTVREANPRRPEVVPAAGADPQRAGDQAANGRAMLAALRDDPEAVRLLLDATHRALAAGRAPGDDTVLLLGELAERARHPGAAEELYRRCLARGHTPRGTEAEVYSGLLAVLQAEHKYAEVIALCKQGLAEARETNRLLFFDRLASAHAALGQFTEALAAADETVKLADENRLPFRIRRAAVLTQAGRHGEAVAACRALLGEYNQPQAGEGARDAGRRAARVRAVRLELSQALLAAGEHEQSEEQLRLILEADPDDETANNNLGYQWAERGVRLDEAERMIRKAIESDRRQRRAAPGGEADSENAAYVDSLGWVLFRKGDLKGALAELEKAAASPGGDDDPTVWDHLGDALSRSGQKDRGAAAWRKALALYEAGGRPKDGRYREIQQKLRQTAP